MSIVSLKTELRQQMKLTPQLLQSIELLQMNSQELLSYLGRMAEENPTLSFRTRRTWRILLSGCGRGLRGWMPESRALSELTGRTLCWSRELRTGV